MTRILNRVIAASCLLVVATSSRVIALTPAPINFQGLLTDTNGDPVPDGSYLVKFIIYDAPSAGAPLWNSNYQVVSTTGGLFTYELGSIQPFPDGLFSDSSRWLGITVDVDPEMTPRTKLTSQAYAKVAMKSDTASIATSVTDNSIDGFAILDGSIGAADIGIDAVDASKILDEPGIAQGRNENAFVLLQPTMTDLTTVTITIPRDGYIFVQGRTRIELSGTTLLNAATVQIDETQGGVEINGIFSFVGSQIYGSTGWYNYDCSAQRTYFKSAGTYTFRLEANHASANGQARALFPILTAIYLPTSYGAVAISGVN